MMTLIAKWLFGTRKKQLDMTVISDMYYLSIQIDREKKEHLDKINLFVKMLNEQNVEWETFTTEPSMLTRDNESRYIPFNVCVKMKHKNELERIYKDLYV